MNNFRKFLGSIAVVLVLGSCGENSKSINTKRSFPVYSSEGLASVMQGTSSWESLSNWQVKRKEEWNRRNYEFLRCDMDKDGMLTGEEVKEYCSLPIFNYSFR